MSVEAPARLGARSAHAGRMQATSNAERRDVSVVKVAILFRPEPYDAGSTCSLQDPTWFVLKAMFAMAYLPKEKLVIEADRFTRPAPSLGARARRPARA